MNRIQLLLLKLCEECNEVAQMASKSSQFGLDEVCPKLGISNQARLHQELNDLNAIVEMLNDEAGLGYRLDRKEINAKKDKVNKYARYAQLLGNVEQQQ